MHNGKIIYQETQITAENAAALNLIIVDENGDIWLKQDTNRSVKITGDLTLN